MITQDNLSNYMVRKDNNQGNNHNFFIEKNLSYILIVTF